MVAQQMDTCARPRKMTRTYSEAVADPWEGEGEKKKSTARRYKALVLGSARLLEPC